MIRFLMCTFTAGILAMSSASLAETRSPNQSSLETANFFSLEWLFGTNRSAANQPRSSTSARSAPRSVNYSTRNRASTRINPRYLPRLVPIQTKHAKGTIIIDTPKRYLFLVLGNGQAMRYGVGVGRPGFAWAGTHRITRKAEWPGWTPPSAMRKRQPGLPAYMPGGPDNPLGARALYLGSTLYRIHGSNQPWTIGQAVSSGCIRMRNEDVIDLYKRVGVGAKVIVI
jgi:lipoprotein-anchoring transpeptidase ErfK/SrfK